MEVKMVTERDIMAAEIGMSFGWPGAAEAWLYLTTEYNKSKYSLSPEIGMLFAWDGDRWYYVKADK